MQTTMHSKLPRDLALFGKHKLQITFGRLTHSCHQPTSHGQIVSRVSTFIPQNHGYYLVSTKAPSTFTTTKPAQSSKLLKLQRFQCDASNLSLAKTGLSLVQTTSSSGSSTTTHTKKSLLLRHTRTTSDVSQSIQPQASCSREVMI